MRFLKNITIKSNYLILPIALLFINNAMAKVVEMTKAYKIWAKRCIVEPYPKQKKRNKNVFYTHNFLTLLL